MLKHHIDPGHMYHRAHFLDVLADMLPKGIAHLGKRVVSYSHTSSSPVQIEFADGSFADCDVLLGCDGIKSVVRRCIFEGLAKEGNAEMLKYVEPVWTGEVLYRCLIPSERLPVKDGQKHPVLKRPIMVSL